MFFWNSVVFLMIQWMLAIWSLVPLPFLNLGWTLEVHGSHTVEAWLGEFWALLYSHVRWVQLCSSLSILWHCLSLGLEWKLTSSSPVAIAGFSKFAGILSAAFSQHHLLGLGILCIQIFTIMKMLFRTFLLPASLVTWFCRDGFWRVSIAYCHMKMPIANT